MTYMTYCCVWHTVAHHYCRNRVKPLGRLIYYGKWPTLDGQSPTWTGRACWYTRFGNAVMHPSYPPKLSNKIHQITSKSHWKVIENNINVKFPCIQFKLNLWWLTYVVRWMHPQWWKLASSKMYILTIRLVVPLQICRIPCLMCTQIARFMGSTWGQPGYLFWMFSAPFWF